MEVSAVKTTSVHEGAAAESGSLQDTEVAKIAEQETLCSFLDGRRALSTAVSRQRRHHKACISGRKTRLASR